ncbi:unnamed protein product [Dovyalis caffra]|uniref:Uncharacterized protein n=1 Tax=Dovyalis caffra TaxID=77055 RepID=A0AAV1SU00_9ROSI|nr:unnamed protein product [Dovyalis caffra]
MPIFYAKKGIEEDANVALDIAFETVETPTSQWLEVFDGSCDKVYEWDWIARGLAEFGLSWADIFSPLAWAGPKPK